MASRAETAISNEYENLNNNWRIPTSEADSYAGSIIDNYGVAIIMLQIESKSKTITSMYWVMPKGNKYGAAFCSWLSKLVIGKTLEEARQLRRSDVETFAGIRWPKKKRIFTLPPLDALSRAIHSYGHI